MTPVWAFIDDNVGCGNIVVDKETRLVLWSPPYFRTLIGKSIDRCNARRFKIIFQGELSQAEKVAYHLQKKEKP